MSLAFTQAQKALTSIRRMIPRLVTTGVVQSGEPILYCDPQNVPPVMEFLKNHTGTRCKQVVDITAIDIPTREKRFEVSYQLLSIDHNSRIRVKTLVGGHEGDDGVPSIVDLFSSANWYEREVWDMYGIYFGAPRAASTQERASAARQRLPSPPPKSAAPHISLSRCAARVRRGPP